MLAWLRLFCQPTGSPPDEVGSEEHAAFLQIDGWLGAHLDLVQIENLFAFFDPGFDGLPAVVMVEPR